MDDRRALVSAILRTPAIRNKVVVLCEGDRLMFDGEHAPSPQMYSRLENTPDSSFYQACVPRRWCGRRIPRFFNCGGRADVLYTFTALREAHLADPAGSYLDPNRLYAIVDVDLQAEDMPVEHRHLWPTTEDVHAALYQDGALKPNIDDRHRIWVTALIHKEAFFVLPEVSAALEGDSPFFRGAALDLRAFHLAVAERLTMDVDVAQRLDLVKSRLLRFAVGHSLACENGDALRASWQAMAAQASHDEYRALVRALFAVAKVKPLWSELLPDPHHGRTIPAENFREGVALKVARSIAEFEPNEHPLASFFAWLEPRR